MRQRRAPVPWLSLLALSVGASFAPGCSDETVGAVEPTPTPTEVRIEPLELVSLSPDDQSEDLARDTAVVAVFNTPLDAATLLGDAFRLRVSETQEPVAFELQHQAEAFTVRLVPLEPLGAWVRYDAIISAAVANTDGETLGTLASTSFRTLDDVPPSAPGTPEDQGEIATNPNLAFTWAVATDEGSGVASYLIELGLTPGGAELAAEELGDVTSYAFEAADGQTVYLRVAAVDRAGNQGPWSEPSDGIFVDASPPEPPSPPRDQGEWDDGVVTFEWDPAVDEESEVVTYLLEIGSTPSGNDLYELRFDREDDAELPLTFDASAEHGQTLFARVKAINAVGLESVWSLSSDGITVDLLAPAATVGFVSTYEQRPPLEGTIVGGGEGESPIGGVVVSIDGRSYRSPQVVFDAETWSLPADTIIPVEGGLYDVLVQVVDVAGNEGTDDTTDELFVDPTAPNAPGRPAEAGPGEGVSRLVFNWEPAVDDESGIADYILQIGTSPGAGDIHDDLVGGPLVSADIDVSAAEDATLWARARAVNGVGLLGPWSEKSLPIESDSTRPFVTYHEPTGDEVSTTAELVLEFSEPMVTESVELALGLDPPPAYGFFFDWNEAGTRVRIIADTADPPGLSNADILLEDTFYTLSVGELATDRAGNPLVAFSDVFRTRDELAPRLIRAFAADLDGIAEPTRPGDNEIGDTILFTWSEDMDPYNGRVRFEARHRRVIDVSMDDIPLTEIEGRDGLLYISTPFPHRLRPGDRVDIHATEPASLNVTGAEVLDTPAGVVFTIDASYVNAGGESPGFEGFAPSPGFAVMFKGYGATIEWVSERELAMHLDVRLWPGHEYNVELDSFLDVGRENEGRGGLVWQVLNPNEDLVVPYVLSTIPADGAAEISPVNPILVAFSEPMNKRRAAAISVTFPDIPENFFEVEYSTGAATGVGVTFRPRQAMPAGVEVTVLVPSTVTDLHGNELAEPLTFTYVTEAVGDTAPPVLGYSTPADGADNASPFSGVELFFVDGATGLPEYLDRETVSSRDIIVVDEDTGFPVRGFSIFVHPVRGSILVTGGDEGDLGWGELPPRQIFSATGDGVFVTYTTDQPHGIESGHFVQVMGMDDDRFDTDWVEVFAVPSEDSFQIEMPLTGSGVGGEVNAAYARTFTVVAGLGGGFEDRGIADMSGNYLEEVSITFTVPPPAFNRTPAAVGPRLIGVTAPAAVSLYVRSNVRDDDNDPMDVLLADVRQDEASEAPVYVLSDQTFSGSWEVGNVGVPIEDFEGMSGDLYPTSGFYPMTFSLDDGQGASASYDLRLWMWNPEDAPSAAAVAGQPVDADELRYITDSTPSLAWDNVDEVGADTLVISADPLTFGSMREQVFTVTLSPTGTLGELDEIDVTPHWALAPNLYVWTVAQQKHDVRFEELLGKGWSLDLVNRDSRFFFLVGPDNEALRGTTYSFAEFGYEQADWDGSIIDSWTQSGTLSFARAFLADGSMRRADGGSRTDDFYFGYEASSRRLGLSPNLRPMARGWTFADGDFYMLNIGGNTDVALVSFGVRRDAFAGFSTEDLAGDQAFLSLEYSYDVNLESVVAGAGVASLSAGSGTLMAAYSDERGVAGGGSLGYQVNGLGDALLTLNGNRRLRGTVGGSPAAPALATTSDDDGGAPVFLLMAPYHDLSGGDATMVSGSFNYIEYIHRAEPAARELTTETRRGTIVFDGAGTATVRYAPGGEPIETLEAYAVDPDTGAVLLGDFVVTPARGGDVMFGVVPDSGTEQRLRIIGR